jgi:hypothetical protein
VVSSAQTGWLVRRGDAPPEGAIQSVELSYERLGPISSRLTAIVPGDGGAIMSRTNEFVLLYDVIGAGSFEQRSELLTRTGQFVRDRSNVGP